MVTAVVGANWGDEGKGKITDVLAEDAKVVIRFQGGANAGHTIINNYGRFALHTLPSGVFHSDVVNIIGNGVALDMTKLLKEINDLLDNGVPMPHIKISDRIQILMPYHILQDTYEEERLGKNSYGSTKSGIAPFYSDKYAKKGIQICDLEYPERLKKKIRDIVEYKNIIFKALYGKDIGYNEDELVWMLLDTYNKLKKIGVDIIDLPIFIQECLKNKDRILLEGQLGSLKDPDFGIYPMVTSSHTVAGFGCVGGCIPPTKMDSVVAVTKAYSSSVGSNTEPFVSELLGAEGDELRRRGGDKGEFGATTGRPRRVGWFDAVATKYGCRVQGATMVALTCLDVLSYLNEIPICVGYRLENGVTSEFPTTAKLEKAEGIFEKLPGWKCDIRGINEYKDLPKNAQIYVEYLEKLIGVPIGMVSTGPSRDDIIYRWNFNK